MQHKHHIARRRGFSSGLPWKKDKASSKCKLTALLESLGNVLYSNQSGSRHSVKNRADIKYCGESTWIKHWYFPRILLPSIPRVTIHDLLELILRCFQDTFGVITNDGEGSFTKCNRWRIPKNSSQTFKLHLNEDIPISQVSNQGGAL